MCRKPPLGAVYTVELIHIIAMLFVDKINFDVYQFDWSKI